MQNNSSKFKIFLVLLCCFSLFALSFELCSAYKLLQPIPGLGEELAAKGGFTTYLSWIFKFALASAAFLAVLQITIGGIQYIISGASESLRTRAHDKITDALWGILLALAAWLILYTINPDLAKMKLEIPPVEIVAGTSARNDYRVSEADARKQISGMGIEVKGECPSGTSVKCVKMDGIRQSTIDELANLRQQVGASVPIYVTGGTEGGHTSGVTSHANGYKTDLRLNTELDRYIMANFKPGGTRTDGAEKWVNPQTGSVYALELGEEPHWDIVAVPKE